MEVSFNLRVLLVIIGILALAYVSGLIIFYGTTVPVVYSAVLRSKKYATFPVLGAIVGLCFCGLGFLWNCAPVMRETIIPLVILGSIGLTPLLTCVSLLFAKEPVLVKIRNAAAISAGSASGIGIVVGLSSLGLSDWIGLR